MKYFMLAATAVLMLMTVGCSDEEKSSDTGTDTSVVTTDTSAETTPSDTGDSDTGDTDTGNPADTGDTSSDTAVSD